MVKVVADRTFCGVLKFAITLPNVTSSGLRSHDGVRKYDLRIEAIFALAVEAQSRSRCLHPESVPKPITCRNGTTDLKYGSHRVTLFKSLDPWIDGRSPIRRMSGGAD